MNPVYEKVIQELESGERKSIARKVFTLLQDHPGGLTRRDLVYLIFARHALPDINNDTGDRKIRNTIASMRLRLIPIVSTSGESGYRLDDSPASRQAMLADMLAKRAALDAQIQAASKVWEIPVPYTEPVVATQARLI